MLSFRYVSKRQPGNVLWRQRGLTIVEVFIAATIFMLGFSTLVFLISRAIVNFSYKDNFNALQLAREYMELTLAQSDYESEAFKESRSGRDYEIVRDIQDEPGIVKIRIRVYKERTGQPLMSIYNEKFIH